MGFIDLLLVWLFAYTAPPQTASLDTGASAASHAPVDAQRAPKRISNGF